MCCFSFVGYVAKYVHASSTRSDIGLLVMWMRLKIRMWVQLELEVEVGTSDMICPKGKKVMHVHRKAPHMASVLSAKYNIRHSLAYQWISATYPPSK